MDSNNGNVGGGDLLPKCRRVGLLYDDRMCKHKIPHGRYHFENPNRILSIWDKLKSSDIINRCVVLTAKEAEEDHIALVHSKLHIDLIKDISSKEFDSRNEKAATFDSIYFNEGSSEAASLAAGSVIEVAEKVANGELDSAFAIVRPPGHHAEEGDPMGFCLYNNVAIAASFLLDSKPELGVKKILIVDWDVHHGNGTQKKFWKDPRVLYFSVHRHEFGNFYPKGDGGSYSMTGEGPGVGYNINVPWENDGCGDADYLAAWDHILLPAAEAFGPDLIIISAGFDAAIGDPLGGCRVSPEGYALMLSKLMKFAGGKIVMALEGGYNLSSIANSALACVDVLLYDKSIRGSPETFPFESTWRVIHAVRNELSTFWPVLAEKLPEKVTSKKIPYAHISSSHPEDELFAQLLYFKLASVAKPTYNHIPKRGMVAFESAQFDGMLKKISEFCSALQTTNPDNQYTSVPDVDISRIGAIVKILKDTSDYDTSLLSNDDIALVLKLLRVWPVDKIYPVVDLLRMIILHPDGSTKLLKHMSGEHDVLLELTKKVTAVSPLPANLLTTLRAVNNLFRPSIFHDWLQKHRAEILDQFCSNTLPLIKSVQLTYSTLLLNYAVLLIDKKDEEGQAQVLSAALHIVEEKIFNTDSKFRALVAIGSLMLEGLVGRAGIDFDIESIARIAKDSEDVKVVEVGADIELLAKQKW